MDINWDDHRYFLAIARARSLTAAGKALGVSQPTVSRRLDSLEAKLKVRLFERTRHGYELTATGLELYETVHRLEEHLAEATRRIYGQDLEIAGLLRITCTEILFNGYLASFVWDFLHKNPGIELSMACTQSQLSLNRSDADVALRFTRQPPETLTGRRLTSVAYAIYAARQGPGERFTLANRDTWEWIGVHDDLYNRMLFGSVLPDGPFKHQIDSMTALQSMVRAGIGVSLLPCYVGDRDPGLRRLDPEPVRDSGTDLWILYHPGVGQVHRVRLFADFIAGRIANDRDLFEGRLPV